MRSSDTMPGWDAGACEEELSSSDEEAGGSFNEVFSEDEPAVLSSEEELSSKEAETAELSEEAFGALDSIEQEDSAAHKRSKNRRFNKIPPHIKLSAK